jgi:tetraacyldisaccharide 4'-kinase
MLAPLGWIYGLGASARRKAYASGLLPRERLRSPVISVGGLAMGGSMKTPAVMELARILAARGPAVGVLGHGYRGDDPGPRMVSDGEKPLENVERVGDEALLLAHGLPGCPVVVGRDKVAAGRMLEEKFGKRIIVVDSGFQHLRLFRDIDIVCVSERDLRDGVVPSGMLREGPGALRSAHIIFTDRVTDGPLVARLRELRPRDVFSVARSDWGFFAADGSGKEVDPPARAFVVCGIGRPERFVTDLESVGVAVVGHRFFRDHHPYSPGDLAAVGKAAEAAGANAVITTTKDAVRIQSWPGSLPLLALVASLEIERLGQVLKRIDEAILARIKAGR